MPTAIATHSESRNTGPGLRLTYTARIDYIKGNSFPHFSITGELRDTGIAGDRGLLCCGQMANDIASMWDDDFVTLMLQLHLSSFPSGEPMHAIENAFYWYGGTKWVARNNTILAQHLRIPLADAECIPDGLYKDAFVADIVRPLREQWALEARSAFAMFQDMGGVDYAVLSRLNNELGLGFEVWEGVTL